MNKFNQDENIDIEDVWKAFRENKKWFNYTRKSHLELRIKEKQIIFKDGVIITFKQNKSNRKIGVDSNVRVSKDSYTLHQILNTQQGNGKASEIIKEFFDVAKTVYLTVRVDNHRANAFYKKMGMPEVGYINWTDGTIKGKVWKYDGDMYEQI